MSSLECKPVIKAEYESLSDLWKISIAFWSALKAFGEGIVREYCSLGEGRTR